MPTITHLFILLILINSILIPSFSCPLHQKQALLNFKSHISDFDPTYGDSHIYKSWSPHSDCCSWNRVKCSRTRNGTGTRTVIGLYLSDTIPLLRSSDILTSLFHIRSLKLLDISMNYLSGEIPEDGFGNLTQLVHLDMSANDFNGSIPNQIFGLTNLRYLDMNLNLFEGNFGSELGVYPLWNLTSLRVLHLGYNNLLGVLSPEVGNLQYLESLNLHETHLMGNIPEEIGNLTKLRNLDLGKNFFSGEIPSSIANMKDLQRLDLSYNSFSVQIPRAIGRLPKMATLYLNNNQFLGPIPSWI